MSYEYSSRVSVIRLEQVRHRWSIRFKGRQGGPWNSADAAAEALAHHQIGLAEWDHAGLDVPKDLLHWRPLGDSL